jgi:hypothetical protein
VQEIICRTPEGPTEVCTWGDVRRRARLCSLALRRLGVRCGTYAVVPQRAQDWVLFSASCSQLPSSVEGSCVGLLYIVRRPSARYRSYTLVLLVMSITCVGRLAH